MYKLAASFVSALGLYAQVATAQNNGAPIQLPEVTGAGSGGGGSGCNGCYVVADVAGVAFGTETLNAVQSQNVIIGRNGSSYTTTSLIIQQGKFTVGPSGLAAAPAPTGSAGVAYNTDGTTLVISGVTLTSPTAYNVFTAYSVTSSVYTNGACSVVAGPASNLDTAFSVAIPPNVDFASFQIAAESSFIAHIGLPSCSPGGENYQGTTHVPVNITTTAVTTTATGRLTPMPVSVAATTTGPTASTQTTFIPFSPIANASRATYLPNGTGTIVIPVASSNVPANPSATIAVAGAPRIDTAWFAGIAALFAGIVA